MIYTRPSGNYFLISQLDTEADGGKDSPLFLICVDDSFSPLTRPRAKQKEKTPSLHRAMTVTR